MATVFAAHYLDGQTPVRRRASVRVAATGLEIAVEGGATPPRSRRICSPA